MSNVILGTLTSVTAAGVIDPERKLQLDDFKPYAKHVLVNSLFSKYAKLEW